MPDVYSDPSSVDTETVTSDAWWLKDPEDPTLNREVDVRGPLRTERREEQAVFRPLGRDRPVVVSGSLTGEEGEVEIDVFTQTAFDEIEALRATQRVLLLQSPFEDQWYVRLGPARRSEFTYAAGSERHRTVTIGFVEVDQP